jgi:hypothetical protein
MTWELGAGFSLSSVRSSSQDGRRAYLSHWVLTVLLGIFGFLLEFLNLLGIGIGLKFRGKVRGKGVGEFWIA